MLSQQELGQICRGYEISCPICGTSATHFRLKRDMARPAKTEGDGHPTTWKWGKPGFDSVDPKQFFKGVCGKCGFAGELEDAELRTAAKDAEKFKRDLVDSEVQLLVAGVTTDKGAKQSLLRRISAADPSVAPSPRFTWESASVCGVGSRWGRLRATACGWPGSTGRKTLSTPAWGRVAPPYSAGGDWLPPVRANRQRRRLQKAASFFRGAMQCLSIISDKSIIGGVVNRAREILEVSGRGRANSGR